MQRERISENVYWFQSDVYAQVTAGVVTGPKWAVVIDTLPVPEETLAMRNFIEEQLEVPVQYIINSHFHADHTWGNNFFPGATIISHELCRQFQIRFGQTSLEAAQKQNPIFKSAKIVYPHLTFENGSLSLRVGKKNLSLFPTPGHSPDGISVLIEEDRVLFAADAFLPIPYFVNGDLEALMTTLSSFTDLGLENIVQGHGDIVLRGEIEETIQSNINYLKNLQKFVKKALKNKHPLRAAAEIDVVACGKDRVMLGGLGDTLHANNVRWLLAQYAAEAGIALNDTPDDDFDDDIVDE
jgi:glyoxylase-like metal-dependent hydrolase (beta-lactamase superfamily II)